MGRSRRAEEPQSSRGSKAGTPETASQALARARRHARLAAAEALAAVQALLDAGALATSGEPSGVHPLIRPVAEVLEDLKQRLEGDARAGGEPLIAALSDALDAEIARWEVRARNDADARAVLRAFLGVRELLWEFGVRPPADTEAGQSKRAESKPSRPPRVQRVRVQG